MFRVVMALLIFLLLSTAIFCSSDEDTSPVFRTSGLHELLKRADGVINKDGRFDYAAAELIIRVSLVAGIMRGVIKICSETISSGFNAMLRGAPYLWHILTKLFFTSVDKLCNCVDPYDVEKIELYKSMFENIMEALCQEDFFRKDIATELVIEESQESTAPNQNWKFYSSFVDRVFSCIILELQAGQLYYKLAQERSKQKNVFDKIVGGMMVRDKSAIVFVSTVLIQNIEHINNLCKEVRCYEDIEQEHLKKIFNNTRHLFQKLCGLLRSPGFAIENQEHGGVDVGFDNFGAVDW